MLALGPIGPPVPTVYRESTRRRTQACSPREGDLMLLLTVMTVVAVSVAVVALQNGQMAPVALLAWQFDAPVALIILASTAAGLVVGGLIGFGRAVRRWTHRRDVTGKHQSAPLARPDP